jgi:two-component system, chemotaxis family, CheB/CheR fusion protein
VKEDEKQNGVQAEFPVVGLGASAGGLEALTAFFEATPLNSGMAFVVVQHLSVQQESILDEIIQRHTRINVETISDGTVIEKNQVYVLPAGYETSIDENKRLSLVPKTKDEGWPETISRFFRSLAEAWRERAAVVILSGAGYDGTEGARAIRDSGGLVIAQDLDSSLQDGMPFSVIDAGLANAVLAPDFMPAYLLKHFEIKLPKIPQLADLSEAITDEELKRILRQLRLHTSNYDFGDYKETTLRRQIARRMSAHRLNTAKAYIALLKQKPNEVEQLVKSLLVHVTRFFRDPEAFEALKVNGLLPLLKNLSIDNIFRVWVPGCASGEEAVSLAILIYECLRELDMMEMEVRIFATDMNRDLIQRGRSGVYPASITEEMTETRLRDHFIAIDTGYQVRTHISRMIVWAEHNLIEHPPFSNLYLISCRNVLIYFQPQLQDKVRALFQFGLRPDGILFLGSSEAMPVTGDLFTVIDSKHKIYRRMAGLAQQWLRLDQPLFAKVLPRLEASLPQQAIRNRENPFLRVIEEMLLSHYNSTCVIVDENYQIRYTYGEIDRYLRLIPGGELQSSVLNMAREGLDVELTISLHEADNTQQTIIREGVQVKNRNDEYPINLIVKPIDESFGKGFKLLIFEPKPIAQNPGEMSSGDGDGADGHALNQLRTESQRIHLALQSATQALQDKSAELVSSIDEISSANKEIQTTNEELRTSKEELESLNEELNTLNTQLTNQNQELGYVNNALFNFLQSTAIGVIFLDLRLMIRDYTQAATKLFSLRKSDIGRPLAEIRTQFVYTNLIEDAKHVLDSLETTEVELSTQENNWYKVEVRPYRTLNNAIDGLVLTFSDITIQKQAQHQAEQQSVYMREVFDTIENSLLELDGDLRVVAANTQFYEQFQVGPEETIGRLLYHLGNGQWDIPDLRRLLTEIIPEQRFVRDYKVSHDFPKLGKQTVLLNARQIDSVNRLLLVFTDIIPPDGND